MENQNNNQGLDFGKLLEKDNINIPQVGDIIKATVVSASKAEVKLDVESGATMADALKRHPKAFDDLFVNQHVDIAPV